MIIWRRRSFNIFIHKVITSIYRYKREYIDKKTSSKIRKDKIRVSNNRIKISKNKTT